MPSVQSHQNRKKWRYIMTDYGHLRGEEEFASFELVGCGKERKGRVNETFFNGLWREELLDRGIAFDIRCQA